jgi:hypothetical protein
LKDARVFHAYLEDWENMQFGCKGDEVHAAKVSARYEGLKNLDADRDDMVGTFRELDCAIPTKRKKIGKTRTRTQKAGRGLGYFYSILGVHDAYDTVFGLENQSDMVYDIWERYWDTYSMIIDYYEKYPDQDVIIVWPARMIKMMMMVVVK